MRGLQAGIHRTSNKTIEFFGQYSVVQQGGSPVGLGVLASIDGTNNFRDVYSPAFGVVVSRTLGGRGALYFEPIWVGNSNTGPDVAGIDNDTVMLGVAARLRVLPDRLPRRRNPSAGLGLRPRRDARLVRASKSAPAATCSS